MLFAGHGGRVTSGMSLSAYVVKNLALEMKDDSHPREAILKHAKVLLEFCIWKKTFLQYRKIQQPDAEYIMWSTISTKSVWDSYNNRGDRELLLESYKRHSMAFPPPPPPGGLPYVVFELFWAVFQLFWSEIRYGFLGKPPKVFTRRYYLFSLVFLSSHEKEYKRWNQKNIISYESCYGK